jgi:hypothetical protein
VSAPSRREVLGLGLLALGGFAAGCGPAPAPFEVPPGCPEEAADAWEGARRLGEALLADGLPESDARALEATLDGALDDPSVLDALGELHQEDLSAGRTVRADGWLLSRTEARWYALVALTPA